MGGLWSGYRRWPRKMTVEECLFLDINEMLRLGPSAKHTPVFLKSINAMRKREVASISFKIDSKRENGPLIIFKYEVRQKGKKQKVEEPIHLQSTRPHFGGLRWWFTCPLTLGKSPCARRVGKLYLPPGGVYFGCRHCYDLTYRSCQESHRRDWLSEHITGRIQGAMPAMVKKALAGLWEQNALVNLPLWGV